MKIRKSILRLRKQIFKSTKIKIILVLIVVGVVGGVVWAVSHTNTSKYVASGPRSSATLKVESDPTGVSITGTPTCDSQKLNKTTPYDCTADTAFTTTLTVPATITVNGQSYDFQTWDGCSEANTDKKICKVSVKLGQVLTTKATYTKIVAQTQTSNQASESIGCPAAQKYIIIGPQTFIPYGADKLVLYNRTKDYQQPTYAQVWSGSSCKEVALNTPLKATKVPDYPLGSGFSLAASSFVTQTSERTTIPPGGHAYIAVLDRGRSFQPLEAVIRDDGELTIDQAGLVNKFSQITNKTVGSSIEFCGWTDSHTALLNVPLNPSGPSGDVYYYDFKSGTAYQNSSHPSCPY